MSLVPWAARLLCCGSLSRLGLPARVNIDQSSDLVCIRSAIRALGSSREWIESENRHSTLRRAAADAVATGGSALSDRYSVQLTRHHDVFLL